MFALNINVNHLTIKKNQQKKPVSMDANKFLIGLNQSTFIVIAFSEVHEGMDCETPHLRIRIKIGPQYSLHVVRED